MALGVMFPGQGSQSVGMLQDIAADHPLVKDTFAQASDALGEDLWSMAADGPAETLNQTRNTQPVLLAASVAVWRVWQNVSKEPVVAMSGHSLGEYSALVCAGALDFVQAVRLVRKRGDLMQRAVPDGEGAMAAILGLDDDAVVQCCKQAESQVPGHVVSAANFNAPGQVVIAGSRQAVNDAIAVCKDNGAKRAVMLEVSVPSHCQLMLAVSADFAAELRAVDWKMPAVPVIQNVDALTADSESDLTDKLVQQLSSPVRWSQCVQALVVAGVDRAVECGPGNVLGGLAKRIDRSVAVVGIGSVDGLAKALAP